MEKQLGVANRTPVNHATDAGIQARVAFIKRTVKEPKYIKGHLIFV